jgi:2-dehydropantoate 2-reductase
VERYDVIGAGGIGCAAGYALRASGASVTFVDSNAEKVAWGRAHGVVIEGHSPLDADFQIFDEWAPSKDRPVLLCTKCFNNMTVLAHLPPDAQVIPIQNGFDRSFNSRAPFVEGIASFVSECHPQRPHTRITRTGKLHLGVRHSDSRTSSLTLNERVATLAALLRAAPFRVEIVDDILPYKHTKPRGRFTRRYGAATVR